MEFEPSCLCHFTCFALLVKVLLFFSFIYFILFFSFLPTCQCRSAAQRSRRPWRCARLPLSSPGPVSTRLSAPALIIILLPTNTAQLPLETLTPRLPQAASGKEKKEKKNPGREKLAESNNGSDQTAINQQRKHLHVRNVVRSPTPLALMQGAGEPQRQVGGTQMPA